MTHSDAVTGLRALEAGEIQFYDSRGEVWTLAGNWSKGTHRCIFDRGEEGRVGGWLVTQTLEDPFSTISKPNFGTEASFCSIFRDPQD